MKDNLRKILKYLVLKISAVFIIFILIFSLAGCEKIKQSLMGKIEADKSKAQQNASSVDSTGNDAETSADKDASDGSKNNVSSSAGEDTTDQSAPQNNEPEATSSTDSESDLYSQITGNMQPLKAETERLRNFFKKGLDAFEKKDYLIAEYSFNQIKDEYKILEDHLIYYLAKSQLLQNKYDAAETNYSKFKSSFKDSIFSQKANLEYADLSFMKSDYTNAELNYQNFLDTFPSSELAVYCRFQLAVCQEKNNKYLSAFENYKKIWLDNPADEYAKNSYQAIQILIEKKIVDSFVPTNEQIYSRGEKFFNLYWYESAISEFKSLLENLKDTGQSSSSSSLEARTIFKLGMCYFNLRDYSSSRQYLLECYGKYPSGSYADDCLYFLGRASNSLNNESEAIKYYEDILKNFASSNYADDALYRLGRIYFLKDDLKNASSNFERIINEYPGGDRITDAYWELGWIQYKSENFSGAINTFQGMSDRFSEIQLKEKALYWQAKSYEKTGNKQGAIDLYKQILDLNSYSYYTFASQQALEKSGINLQLKSIDNSTSPQNEEISEILPEVFDDLLSDIYNSNNTTDSDKTAESSSTTNSISSSNSGKIQDPGEALNSGKAAVSNNTSSAGTNTADIKTTNESVPDDSTGQKEPEYTHVDKAKELLYLRLYDSASAEIEAAKSQFEDDSYSILQISTFYLLAEDYINSQKIISKYYTKLKNSLSSPYLDYFYYLIYPYGFKEYVDAYSKQFGVDPLFVLAIIREESRFDPGAGSYAGAMGLMQIMPATGKGIAGNLSINSFSNDMLFDPETNIKMGCYYISKQLESFNQNKYFACGAYNGGPGAMSRWISNYGNKEIDEFIEYITYDETRNYIKKVMGSYYFYQMLYK